MEQQRSRAKENLLSKDVGSEYWISDRVLGRGSYGTVYLVQDEKKKKTAVKCCPLDREEGITNLLEAALMSTLIHPFLNRSMRTFCTGSYLYLFQEVARSDLSTLTHRSQGNYKPSAEELRNWSFGLVQAVAVLHREGVIHGDIKASNALIFCDGTVRLTDFTLAVRRTSPRDSFRHIICTPTHRPLECWMDQEWDEAVDIWSLGCTLYEIAYGEQLFSYQGRRYRDHHKERSINALIDWSTKGPNCDKQEKLSLSLHAHDFVPFRLSAEYHDPEMNLFNNLIETMLVAQPQHRASIQTILGHEYFRDLSLACYYVITRPRRKLPISEQARITRYLQRYHDNEQVQKLGLTLYSCCLNLDHLPEQRRALVTTWLASKLILGSTSFPRDCFLSSQEMQELERIICHNLSFRLW